MENLIKANIREVEPGGCLWESSENSSKRGKESVYGDLGRGRAVNTSLGRRVTALPGDRYLN